MVQRNGRLRLTAALGALVGLAGCASSKTWDVSTRPCLDPQLQAVDGVRAVSYTTADGVRHPYRGRVRAESDTLLHFFGADDHRPRPTELPVDTGTTGAELFALSRDEVQQIEYESGGSTSWGYLLGGVALGTLAAYAMWVAVYSGWGE